MSDEQISELVPQEAPISTWQWWQRVVFRERLDTSAYSFTSRRIDWLDDEEDQDG